MSIMDAFRNALGGSAQQTPQQVPPGNIPPNQPPMLAQTQEGQIPPAPTLQPNQQVTPPQSPLADFSNLWEAPTTPPDPNKGAVQFTIDPTKINQVASSIDFTKSIPPELMQKALAGGPEAMQALMQVINTVSQQAFAQSTMANTKVIETALAQQREKFSAEIPDLVRSQSISSTLRQENPLFKNPATAPMLTALETQLAAKFPSATPQEISNHARKYLEGFAAEITKQTAPAASPKQGEIDWSTFM